MISSQCPYGFEWLAPVRFQDGQLLREQPAPALFKGLAQSWPAVRQWRFSHLAQHVSDRPVRLVEGDRERGATRFVDSTLHAYLHSLEEGDRQDAAPLYLKEFDLLKAAPDLRQDLHHAALLGPGKRSSLQSWIGPAHAHTGLHYDYLDNLAVQIIGRKRFYLVRPGVVEAMGALSSKYDAWARLSRSSAQELASGVLGATRDFFVVDLEPGDVLHVPAGWWHQVHNLTPALLLGGFYGSHAKVLARWAWVGVRESLHRCGWLGRGHCTCHTPKEADKARRPSR